MKYITTPIYYVNDSPHIGHAVTTLAADVLARFWRLRGEQVYFLTGTDEHGAKIAEAARKVGKTPHKLADAVTQEFATSWEALNIKPDGFIRTTNSRHKQFVQDFLHKLYDAGHIYPGEYTGWYCVGCEEFKTGTQVGEDNTCPLHKTPLKEVSESAYLFKLSAFSDQLSELIQKDELKIRPESRKNEVLSFLDQGLKDVAISRQNVAWGIEVPWDRSHTVYVWVDALLNYLSAAKGGVFELGAPWPPTLQLIGKDILRFHAVIWPALLLAAGEQLPKELFVHGYFTIGGQKMSKSLSNVIAPQQLIDRYGVDGARYLLLAAVPFGADGDISLARLDDIYNSDLANNLGNLINRVQKLSQNLEFRSRNQHLELKIEGLIEEYKTRFAEVDLSGVLELLKTKLDDLNRYIEQEKPWQLQKTDREKLPVVLGYLVENILALAVLYSPFLPEASGKILSAFGLSSEALAKGDTSVNQINYATLGKTSLVAGNQIKPIAPLFPRLV